MRDYDRIHFKVNRSPKGVLSAVIDNEVTRVTFINDGGTLREALSSREDLTGEGSPKEFPPADLKRFNKKLGNIFRENRPSKEKAQQE